MSSAVPGVFGLHHLVDGAGYDSWLYGRLSHPRPARALCMARDGRTRAA
ncbi:DUF6336 family protein [Streptomyces chartreusis]